MSRAHINKAHRAMTVFGVMCVAMALLVFWLTPGIAQVSTSRTGPCEVTITIPIEIYGPRGTTQVAKEWKEQIESVWNGPTEEAALAIFEDSQLRKDNPDLFKKPSDMRDTIRRKYKDMFGEGMLINCCTIKFVADIIVRAEDADPTEGYNQVKAMPAYYGEWDTLGSIPLIGPYIGEYEVKWFRSFVRHLPESPDDLPGGEWANQAGYPVYAHEVGHLLGIDDHYHDEVDEDGHTHSEANEGHENDLMGGDMQGFLKEEHLRKILKFHNVTCNCCPVNRDEAMYQHFAVTLRAGNDAMAANNCDVLKQSLDDLRDQRANAQLARMPFREKYDFLKRLDEEIERIRKAWLECDPDPVIEETTTGALDDYGLSTDSTEFCTYDDGLATPFGGTYIPGGLYFPGVTPGTTPDDGDGPRDTPGETPDATTPVRPGLTPPRPGLIPTITITPIDDDGDDEPSIPANEGLTPGSTPDDGDDPRDTPPVTVHFKVKKTVLQSDGTRTTTAEPQPGRRLKMIVPELQDPVLPLAYDGEPAKRINMDPLAPLGTYGKDTDTGAGDDPLQCTTDENGECDIDEVEFTGIILAEGGRIDVDVPVQDVKGGVIPDDGSGGGDVPEGGEVTGGFTIGDQSYLRLRWDAGLDLGYRVKLDLKYDWHEDLCKDEQPGPWIGSDLSRFEGMGQSVPQRTLKFSTPSHASSGG